MADHSVEGGAAPALLFDDTADFGSLAETVDTEEVGRLPAFFLFLTDHESPRSHMAFAAWMAAGDLRS